MKADCPCGREAPLRACCGRFLYGGDWPERAEDLMRARYTAYARGALDFLCQSQAPETRASLDLPAMQRWAERCDWQRLRVLSTHGGEPGDDEGTVEFRARYLEDGRPRVHHERSRFRRHAGRWYYCEGSAPAGATVGRNQPCPCGSDSKFKHCCGL